MLSRHAPARWGTLLLAAACVTSCSSFTRTRYAFDTKYPFRGKVIGVCVVLDGDEQQAANDRRVISRTLSTAQDAPYGGGTSFPDMGASAGAIIAPRVVKRLDTDLTHSRYYDEELTHPMIDQTKTVLERHGFGVHVIPVPGGDFALRDLANRASELGCDILAVETISLVRSWNARQEVRSRTASQSSASLRWRTQVGGLVLVNLVLLDIGTGKIVWEHARNEIDVDILPAILGQLYDERLATSRFASRPGRYQGWLYRRSAERALHLVFATNESGSHPLPAGSGVPDSLRRSARYEPGRQVFVRPTGASRVWHLATVVSDSAARVRIRWTKGMWPEHARRTVVPRTDVMPMPDPFVPIVWVRRRDRLSYMPYRFERAAERDGLAYVSRAGDVQDRTFLLGRVGIIPE